MEGRLSIEQKKKLKARVNKSKRFLFGMQGKEGVLLKTFVYVLLICIGFVYLYPLIYMVSFSFKSLEDLLSPLVNWIPSQFYFDNYLRATNVLSFLPTLMQSFYVTVLPALAQTAVAGVIGYGFARFDFPLKRTLFVLVLATFVVPPQVTMIPRYVFFNELGLLGNIQAFLIPAVLGQGLNSAIFILIFYQFFKMIPKSLEEAAQLDGAGVVRVFTTIAIPMAVPAIIISFLFSFVWYWNETYLASLYFGNQLSTLPLELQRFVATFNQLYSGNDSGANSINEGVRMAGTVLSILPLLLVYFLTQKWFVEGVDRSGITGE
ncbi:carbohydrate ABC transporter permease [Bacillus sp. H-16]|uniref:carbohydrate ABC transporter permease n=1 Tax=Alteribacter salitolerans TaxID=2912333 RepID=UPI001965727D|nr:carbohydrate ABC transporter permease [Alteribacter salitolerans]MBM7097906.1 carbohydrate ABC transporter permease [Alteribacter salitolerans]